MIEYEIKSNPYKGNIARIPSTPEEIRPLIPTIFSLHNILLMSRGISEEISLDHPHVRTIQEILSSVVEMNDTNIWAIRTQVHQIHLNYVSISMEDSFRYTLLENIFVYPEMESLDLVWGQIEALPIRENYWNISYPYFHTKPSPMFPDLSLSISFNIRKDSIHEYAIGFLRELEWQETNAGGNLFETLDDIILNVNENIKDYS